MCCAGKTLLNLDTEDWGEIFIGCAGGGDSMITLPVQHEALDASSADAYTITVSGSLLRGPNLSLPCAIGCLASAHRRQSQSGVSGLVSIRVLGTWHLAWL